MIPFQIMTHLNPTHPTKTMYYAIFVYALKVGVWDDLTTEFKRAVPDVQDGEYSDKTSVSRFLSNAFKVPIDEIRFEAIASF